MRRHIIMGGLTAAVLAASGVIAQTAPDTPALSDFARKKMAGNAADLKVATHFPPGYGVATRLTPDDDLPPPGGVRCLRWTGRGYQPWVC